jgi:hypothetical protein
MKGLIQSYHEFGIAEVLMAIYLYIGYENKRAPSLALYIVQYQGTHVRGSLLVSTMHFYKIIFFFFLRQIPADESSFEASSTRDDIVSAS